MNGGSKLRGRLGVEAAAMIALAIVMSACGPDGESTSAPPRAGVSEAEVRGEPIRGEPIAPAVESAAAQATTLSSGSSQPSAQAFIEASSEPKRTPEVAVAAGNQESRPTAVVATASARVTATVTNNAVVAVISNAAPTVAGAVNVGTPENPLPVGFDRLASFPYVLPEGVVDTNAIAQAGTKQQIPQGILALNSQSVSIKGFMLPLKVEKGLVTELLIMRDQSMCCFGTVPKINEWVSVKMTGGGVKPVMDQAVTLFGKLKVGEMYENGYLVGIYSLDGERMAGPLDL